MACRLAIRAVAHSTIQWWIQRRDDGRFLCVCSSRATEALPFFLVCKHPAVLMSTRCLRQTPIAYANSLGLRASLTCPRTLAHYPVVPQTCTYTISIEDGGRRHTVRVAEPITDA